MKPKPHNQQPQFKDPKQKQNKTNNQPPPHKSNNIKHPTKQNYQTKPIPQTQQQNKATKKINIPKETQVTTY